MDITSALDTQTIVSSYINTGTATEQTAEEIAAEDAEQQKVDFLNILLTQLENQNPLDPMDTADTTAQLTRYSQLEQQIEMNEKLAVTNSLLAESTTSANFSYIGKSVELYSNASVAQNGEASWSYIVDGQASEVALTVKDEDGNTVHETDGSIELGAHAFTLDTTTLSLEEGAELYLYVAANDSSAEPLDTEVSAHITVDGLWSDSSQTYLTAGQISFLPSNILKIEETI